MKLAIGLGLAACILLGMLVISSRFEIIIVGENYPVRVDRWFGDAQSVRIESPESRKTADNLNPTSRKLADSVRALQSEFDRLQADVVCMAAIEKLEDSILSYTVLERIEARRARLRDIADSIFLEIEAMPSGWERRQALARMGIDSLTAAVWEAKKRITLLWRSEHGGQPAVDSN